MQDKELFQALNDSAIGGRLVEYLKRKENEIYDSRNWEEGVTPALAKLAARPVRELINNVTILAEHKDEDVNVCE